MILIVPLILALGFTASPTVHAVDTKWNRPISNACLIGNDDWVGSASSMAMCRYYCLLFTTQTCLSIDYKSGTCLLSKTNRLLTPSAYSTSCSGWTYQHRLGLGFWSPMKYACIRGHNSFVGKSKNAYACKVRCYHSRNCCSYEYKNGYCLLSSVKKSTVQPSSDYKEPCSGWLYSERTDRSCSTGLESYEWKGIVFGCIKGKNKKIINSISFNTCRKRCVQESSFVCTSIDYKSNVCQLSEYTAATAGSDYKQPCHVSGWYYAERKGCSWSYSSFHRCIAGNDALVVPARDITACMIKCCREKVFTCRSIEFKNGSCRLSPLHRTSPLASYGSCIGWYFAQRY